MSDEAKKKTDAPAAGHGDEKKKGGLMTKTPVLLGAVMLMEAVVLFAGFKFLGAGAKASQGADLSQGTESTEGHGDSEAAHGEGGEAAPKKPVDKKKPVEAMVVEFRAPNKVSGRTFLYDVSIYLVTRAEHEEKVKGTLTDRAQLIRDRVRTIIAQMDPEKLGGGTEPGLETLRRQVKYQLDEIIGEGLIDEVLVPKCIPMRTDY